MASEIFSKKCRLFLSVLISSVQELEILLLLYREPGKRWFPQAVATTAFISENAARDILESLVTKNLLKSSEGVYFFEAEDEELRKTVQEVSSLYVTHRTRVIENIYSADEKIRLFADSFVVKKEK